jgi:hypothetical protein
MKRILETELKDGDVGVCVEYSDVLDNRAHPLARALAYSKKGLYIGDTWGIPTLKGINKLVKSSKPIRKKVDFDSQTEVKEYKVQKRVNNYYLNKLNVTLEDIEL